MILLGLGPICGADIVTRCGRAPDALPSLVERSLTRNRGYVVRWPSARGPRSATR